MTAPKFTDYVDGSRGELLAKANLPPPRTTRWVPRRKAEVVSAVQSGLLSLHEACEMYTLTVEEFLSWQSAMDRFGLAGLRTTHAQEYRSIQKEKPRRDRKPVSYDRPPRVEGRFEYYRSVL